MARTTIILVFSFIFFCNGAFAQIDFSPKTWRLLDSSIEKKRNLAEIMNIVLQLRRKATEEKKYFLAARCYDYQMRIADLRTNDTLYFKNSSFLDSLLAQQGLPESLELSLRVMLANRLNHFTRLFKNFQQQKYERTDIRINYAAYAIAQIDSIAILHFEKAKAIARKMAGTGIEDALWLSSDPLLFLYKPVLYDLVIAEQIQAGGYRTGYYTAPPAESETWLDLGIAAFIQKLDSVYNNRKSSAGSFALYGEWLKYHEADDGAFHYIETLARKYLYDLAGNNYPEVQKKYENYLVDISGSSFREAKAHAIYQLCLLWNSQSKKYFPLKYTSYNSSLYEKQNDYDTAYRYHAQKALLLFRNNRALFGDFGYLKEILVQMEAKIMETEMSMVIERNNLPEEPVLGELRFKNADSVYYRIVKLLPDHPLFVSDNKALLAKPFFIERSLRLPQADDYNRHALYLKIDTLPAGKYALLFSAKSFSNPSYKINTLFFNVTNIAVVNNDTRVYVLNRRTGFPLAGASVKARDTRMVIRNGDTTFKDITKLFTVNKQGYIIVRDKTLGELEISYKQDTIFENISYQEYEMPDDIYTKDEYDDLVEFYEENAKACIFTDRSIYRPGQTVHYKVLFITRNRKNGEPMVMSRKNLRGKLFENVYKKWQKEEEPWLFIEDPFGKDMDSLKIEPDAYGAVAGSFILPKTAATGEWEIAPDYIDKDWDAGTFKVEEYKRPSYEITVENPKKELRPGDEFAWKVKIRSFAGASLSNIRIEYTVVRNTRQPVTLINNGYSPANGRVTLSDTIGYANAEGELEVLVKDTELKSLRRSDNEKWDFDYSLQVEAIESTGESCEAKASVYVSTMPLQIKMGFIEKYNRSDPPVVFVNVQDGNAGGVTKDIIVKIYRVDKRERSFSERKLVKADLWLYEKNELQNMFPAVDILREENKKNRHLVFTDTINADKKAIRTDTSWFAAGNYEAEAICIENGFLIGEAKREFSVFDEKENKLPEPGLAFDYLPYNYAKPGESLKYYYGNADKEIYSVFHTAYFDGNKKVNIKYFYKEARQDKGVAQHLITVPATATGRLYFTHIYILNNRVYTKTKIIYINDKSAREPEIIVEQYRKKLTPGGKETFSVSVKTSNADIAAELMTTMYDASLDKLQQHRWRIPYFGDHLASIDTRWPSSINSSEGEPRTVDEIFVHGSTISESYQKSLWWLGDANDADVIIPYRGADKLSPDYNLTGKISGLLVANTTGLNEVVVIGYSTVNRRMSAARASVSVRGLSSNNADYSKVLIIVDGVPFEGDAGKINMNGVTEALILKGADATSIYGARASNGVLIISTNGKIVLPKEPEPVTVPRKNFSESAFFFPSVHADKNGFYKLTFTMPESVTEWNWKMLAHTKKGQFAYAERKLNTQLPLMVQPNMPRLLYRGDRIVLQSRISNLDTTDASGKINCRIEDEATGEDVTAQLVAVAQNNFSVSKKAATASSFEIRIPETQLNPLKVIITLRSENFTDGEEHVIPVISSKIFVRQSQSFNFTSKEDTTVRLPQLPAGTEIYGIGLSVHPKPQSALLNSLPYLANYPFWCAEQTFNKLLAHLTGWSIMQTDSLARRSFDKVSAYVEKEQQEKLPDELADETMPWLGIAGKTSLQQRQLYNLLDTSRAAPIVHELMEKLYKFQNPDGGLAWFNGGKSDFYISAYVLKGFMQIPQTVPGQFSSDKQKAFIRQLVNYCDRFFSSLSKNDLNRYNLFYYSYARSYAMTEYPLADTIKKDIRSILLKEWQQVDRKSLNQQALLIIASLRFDQPDSELTAIAVRQLQSLRQLAIEDEQDGLRWKDLSDADDMNNSSEETIALMAEAFETGGMNIRQGILKWLLTSQNEHHWKSTKATAAVIGLLGRENKPVTGISQTITTKADNHIVTVTDDLLNGSSFDFMKTSSLPPAMELKKESPVVANGNIVWYYFTDAGELSRLNREVKMQKQFYKWSQQTAAWELLGENTILKIADKIKVVMKFQSSRPLSYVYIDDKRAAAFEPVDNSSGYEYETGFSYYRSVRDAGFQFFASFIPSGNHEISYELKVTQEGNFTSGPAILQCMYKPEITAYSDNMKVVTVK